MSAAAAPAAADTLGPVPLFDAPEAPVHRPQSQLWLRYWNGGGDDPGEVSCRVAFDTVWFCYSPGFQGRSYYRKGQFDTCKKQFEDLTLCLRATVLNKTDPARAREMLRDGTHLRPARPPARHVWQFRERPPAEFREDGGQK